MTVGLLILNEPILRMMNFSDEIMPDVTAYMGIIYAGLIVTAAYNSLAAFLRVGMRNRHGILGRVPVSKSCAAPHFNKRSKT